MEALRTFVNSLFVNNNDPFSVIVITLTTGATVYISLKLYSSLLKYGISGTFQLFFLSTLKAVPGGNKLIQAQLEKAKKDLIKELNSSFRKSPYKNYMDLPDKPIERKAIRKQLLYQLNQEKSIRNRRGHGGIYVDVNSKYSKYLSDDIDAKDNDIINIINDNLTIKDEAYLYFSHSNCLYPFLFPGTRKFDVELISMASKMLYAKEASGNITSGGTESIFLALKCWRTYAKKEKNIIKPNIVLPITAHPAFCKSSCYLGIETRFVDVISDVNNKLFGTVDLIKMEKLIDKNTICLVGSAPCFPYSVVDDIEGICDISKKHGNIPVHVDNCLGGFYLSFLYDNNSITKLFDFRLKNVSSISCDMHKHAGSDKGCSVILYSSYKYRSYQYYSYVNWPGGLYTSAGFQGSSNGGLKAVAWSMLLNKGKNKIKEESIDLFNKINYLKKQITLKLSDYCDVLGNPIACGVAFKFKDKLNDLDYAIAEALHEVGGWEIVRLQFPSALFYQAGHGWKNEIDTLISDITKSIKLVQNDPVKYNKSGLASVYGACATIPDRELVVDTCGIYLDVVHSPY